MANVTAPQTLCKQPSEKIKFEMHFTQLLDIAGGEKITNVPTVTHEMIGGGTSDLIVTNIAIESTTGTQLDMVTCWIAGGTHARRYRVEVYCETTGGQILEGDGILKVSDK